MLPYQKEKKMKFIPDKETTSVRFKLIPENDEDEEFLKSFDKDSSFKIVQKGVVSEKGVFSIRQVSFYKIG